MVKVRFLLFLLFILVGRNISSDHINISLSSLHFPPITDETLPGYGFIGETFNAIFEPYGYTVNISKPLAQG